MSTTSTRTSTTTFTQEDVENVMRRIGADLVMIASSTGAITEKEAADYGHDVSYLAKKGFLRSVDLTLMSDGVEVKAAKYEVIVGSDEMKTSRPGGLLWPKVASPHLRVVLSYTKDYTATEKTAAAQRLKISWTPTSADLTHATLQSSAGRDYSSNGFGVSRKDYL